MKEKDVDKKQIAILMNDKATLNSELKHTDKEINNHKEAIRSLKNEIKSLSKETQLLKTNSAKFNQLQSEFENEKNALKSTINELNKRLNELADRIKCKENTIGCLNQNLADQRKKFDKMKRIYESIRSNYNLNSKSLLKTKVQLAEFKSKVDRLNSRQFLLSKQIQHDVESLSKTKAECSKKTHSIRKMTDKFHTVRQTIDEYKSKIDSFQTDEQKLLNIIYNQERKYIQLEKTLKLVTLERNILGTQLVRRNDEIYLLYEKIRLLQSFLNRGQVAFESLKRELKSSRLTLSRTKKENDLLKNTQRNKVRILTEKLNQTEKRLALIKTRQNADENMPKLMNVHRWRKLKACDPTTYELILKVNILQKRLIFKSEQLVYMQMKFVEKDRLFVELKQFFARRLTSDDHLQLMQQYKTSLNNADRRLKVNF